MDHRPPAVPRSAPRFPLEDAPRAGCGAPGPGCPPGPPAAPAPLTSVVVASLGRPDAARRCMSALFRHTDGPWELVVVTRGDDATAAYLDGVRDAARVRVVHSPAPRCSGIRAAWARGLRHAKGDRVALLRDTVVVTDAWLRQLVALLEVSPGVGLVGPMSNAAPGPQSAGPVDYDSASPGGLDDFARRWRAGRRGKWLTVDAVGGGCVLAKRRVLEGDGRMVHAGGLRPRRLAIRARRMGLEPAVAFDLYVHEEARRRRVDGPTPAIPARPSPSGPRACRVSLTMIVRDEEHNLPACLGSAADLFDEVVVVDTGSRDRTAEVARSFGARVFEFPWVDDFAAARNAALGHASGDYAFWLDADDRVEPAERDRLRSLLDALRPGGPAYVARCACDPDPAGGGPTVVDHIRLFPLRGDVRWAYRVHEQILPSLRRAGVEVRWSDVTVRHVGYNDPRVRDRKLDRDRAILEREAAERPGDPFVLFNLGQVALHRGDHRAALDYLRRSLAGSAPSDSITRKLFALIAQSHQRLGETGQALATCHEGLAVAPDDPELLFRRGVIHRLRGEPAEAEGCWRRVLTIRRPEGFSSLDVGIFGHVTRRNLARLAEERDDPSEAALQWRAVLSECPGDAEAAAALAGMVMAGAAR